MSVKRVIDTSFWNDEKVIEMFSPEDKLFMLYLLTNPHTTQLGIYRVHEKEIAFEIGYSVDAVRVLIERFENKYKMILVSKATNEIAIKNFLRHSIIKGGAPVRDCLIREIKNVKNKELISWVFGNISNDPYLNETVRKVIIDYQDNNGILYYTNKKNNNDNANENENENDVSYHDTCNDTSTYRSRGISEEDFTANYSLGSGGKNAPIAKPIDYEWFKSVYNTYCRDLPMVTIISDKRKKSIRDFCKQLSLEDFRNACIKANQSDFCRGENDRGWKADFDFVIKVDKALSLVEGKYQNNKRDKTQDQAYTSFDTDDFFQTAINNSYYD